MEPAASADDGQFAPEHFLARLRTNALDPTVLALPLVAAILCLFRSLHLIALEPYWLYIAVLIGSGTIRVIYSGLWSESDHRWYRSGYIGIYMVVIGVVAYTTGWGPILSIGFLFGAAASFQLFGSKATVPCLVWTTIAMALGQLAIGLHLAPTIIREPIVQGVAALGLLGALLVIELLGAAAAGREALEADLRRSEQRFSALVTSSSDIVIIAGADGTLQYASPAFESVLGYPSTAVVNILGETLIHPDDRAGLHAAMAAAGVSRFRHQQGGPPPAHGRRLALVRGRHHQSDRRPQRKGFVADLRDITRRKNAEDQLAHAALHDALTGLPNRTLILNRAEQMLARARRQHTPLAALFLDLDDFKDINDTLGHEAGDQLLAGVAARLTGALREGDTVGRLGGDEFVVLVEGASLAAGSEVVAERIRDVLTTPFSISASDIPLEVTASIGIAEGDRATPGNFCETRTSPSIGPRPEVSIAQWHFRPRCKQPSTITAPSKSTCTMPLITASSSCSTSRPSISPPEHSSAWKHSCAGDTRNVGSYNPIDSSPPRIQRVDRPSGPMGSGRGMPPGC